MKDRTLIPGTKDYFATRTGQIWHRDKQMRPALDSRGYYRANIKVNGKFQRVRVHRIIALCFIGEMPTGCRIIRHLDGNKRNNSLENLKYGTDWENFNLDPSQRLRGSEQKSSKLIESKVIEIRERRARDETLKSLGTDFKVHPVTILRIVRGEKWSHIPSNL